MATDTVRIATHTATGRRYVVIHLDTKRDRVTCWGDVASYTARTVRHHGKRTFKSDAVTVAEVDRHTYHAMLDDLFEQGIDAARERGDIIIGRRVRRGRYAGRMNYTRTGHDTTCHIDADRLGDAVVNIMARRGVNEMVINDVFKAVAYGVAGHPGNLAAFQQRLIDAGFTVRDGFTVTL